VGWVLSLFWRSIELKRKRMPPFVISRAVLLLLFIHRQQAHGGRCATYNCFRLPLSIHLHPPLHSLLVLQLHKSNQAGSLLLLPASRYCQFGERSASKSNRTDSGVVYDILFPPATTAFHTHTYTHIHTHRVSVSLHSFLETSILSADHTLASQFLKDVTSKGRHRSS
jgi:hypothetical protein